MTIKIITKLIKRMMICNCNSLSILLACSTTLSYERWRCNIKVKTNSTPIQRPRTSLVSLKSFNINFVGISAAPNLPFVFILRVIYEADKPHFNYRYMFMEWSWLRKYDPNNSVMKWNERDRQLVVEQWGYIFVFSIILVLYFSFNWNLTM